MNPSDARYMALALSLGQRGLGRVWPNPAVGCVIVKEGRIVGRGWTQPGGRPHAEVVALAEAGEAARGATAYVTLEPCSHHGQTGPCAEALIRAGVTRVVAALEDVDTRVAGRGFQMLRDAGIEVETGVMADKATRHHAGFFLNTSIGRPWVTLKLAMSLDGRIATATGESQWITGPEARRHVHLQRARHDAVMVGGGTARADDPSLTVRLPGLNANPVRVAISRRLDVPLMGQLAQTAKDTPVRLCHGTDADKALIEAWEGLGAKLLPVRSGQGQLDPGTILTALAEAGLTRIYCEGGGALAASLLAADLVDELHVYSAGLALGAEGWPGLGAMGVEKLAQAPRLEVMDSQKIGADVMTIWSRPSFAWQQV